LIQTAYQVIFQFEIATQTRQRGSADLSVLPAPLPAVESNLSAFPVNFAINAMNSLRIYQYLLSNSKKKKGASLSYAAVMTVRIRQCGRFVVVMLQVDTTSQRCGWCC
jgi:hypothetical protein